MRLKRIYASKLYLTSNRKDRINAAIGDAKNTELVQQLSDYLDDPDKEKLDKIIEEKAAAKEAEEAKEAPEAPEEGATPDIPDERNVFSPSYSGGGSFNPPSGDFDDFGSEPGGDIPDAEPSEAPDEPPVPAPDEAVEESTAIYGEVKADTDVGDILVDIAGEAATIKGTLNGKAETAGVQRISVDEKELWIYYEDDVNTRDIMVDVIEALNASAYTYLAFNRLARSNNAIVFDINLSTKEPIKSINEVEEENK